MDPDPAIFVIDLQDASKKLFFYTIFSSCYFLKVHLHYFSKIKCQNESQNSRIQGSSYYFCMMIEGSGSILLTSGSGWTKNMWIRNTVNNPWIKTERPPPFSIILSVKNTTNAATGMFKKKFNRDGTIKEEGRRQGTKAF
jgi:hypothetical protein